MFDSILLSLKGLGRKKLRSALVIILIFTGVFLLNVYAMMTNCIVDMEQIKAEDNIDYKRIIINPYNSVTMEKSGIALYDLRDIKDIPNVASVSLNNTEFEPNDKYELAINSITINGTRFDRFYSLFDGAEAYFSVYPLFDAFDPYNLSKEQLIRKEDHGFSALLCGKWPTASAENEVVLDSITAARFFSLDYSDSIDYSSVCGSRLTVETTNGEEIACTITGVYDYRISLDYKTTKSIEEIEFEQNFVRFRYSADELENNSFFANDICFPLMINKTLASNIYKTIDGGTSNTPPVFINFFGTVDVMADSIDNAESVTGLLEKYGYFISSQIDVAKNAVQRFFFYKEAILLIGVTISVITIIQLISVMVMIVNERKKYMVMLSRIGFRKKNIAHIITGEMIWIGLIGSSLGLFGCFISKFVFESLIEHRLAESGLYKYISLGVTPAMVFATLAICAVICYIIGMVTSLFTLKKQNN